MEKAITIDNCWYERKQEKEGKGPTFFEHKKPKPHQPAWDLMEIDATSRRHSSKEKPRRGKLSQMQRQKRMKKGLCLYCGKPGHQVNQCSNRRQLNAMYQMGDLEWDTKGENMRDPMETSFWEENPVIFEISSLDLKE